MLSGFVRLITNHRSSSPSEAHQKSGSFPPPALPGLSGTMTLSDSRSEPSPYATLKTQPPPAAGLPRLPGSPFRRAVPTTPADQDGAHVGCFPSHAAFPESQAGRRPHLHFRGLLRLHSHYGPSDCSTAPRRPLSQGFSPEGCPARPLASYQIKPTTIWVVPSSTGHPRRRGALRNAGLSEPGKASRTAGKAGLLCAAARDGTAGPTNRVPAALIAVKRPPYIKVTIAPQRGGNSRRGL